MHYRFLFFGLVYVFIYSTCKGNIDLDKLCMKKLSDKNLKCIKSEKTEKGERSVFKSEKDYMTVEVRKSDDSAAKEFQQNKFFLIESLFKEQASPYPGKLSYKIGCPKEFFPEKFEKAYKNDWIRAMKLKANTRYVYGGCTEESNYYYSYLLYYYCAQQQRLIELNYYTPIKQPSLDMDELLNNCSCDH